MLTSAQLVWLLAAVAKADQAAFERLYVATRAKLYGVSLRILKRRDLTDEAIQDTYLKIWTTAGLYDPLVASPVTWMVTIVRNRSIDILRKRGEVSIEDEPQAMDADADSPDPLAGREMADELRQLLGCLGQLEPERQRMVLLAYYDGYSRDQLAQEFGAPANTIKTWLRRSLMQIRDCLQA